MAKKAAAPVEPAVKASAIVIALADMASKGKYDNVTIQAARGFNQLFELVAELINTLEAEEAKESVSE